MIRVLQCVNVMHRAGLETMLMNYYRNIDREQIQFDFLTHRPERGDYDDEIEQMGGRVYYAPRLYPQNFPAYFSYMKRFFAEHPEYRIVHSHIDAMSYLPMLAAKKAGVPIRIAHSHSTSIDRDFKYLLKQCFRILLPSAANAYLACGTEAGRFLFGNRAFQIIPNAVDAEKFYYNEEIRQNKRRQLNLQDEFVVGHVGRMSYPKNHEQLIEIFDAIQKAYPNSKLLLIGVGEKEEEIRNRVKARCLEEKVLFLGKRSDVNELYQAMDVFVLPSRFEGIPVVGIEAQLSDLPCIFSRNVPEESKINSKTCFMSLQEPAQRWADVILQKKDSERSAMKEELCRSDYDIKHAYKKLQEYYLTMEARLESASGKGIRR